MRKYKMDTDEPIEDSSSSSSASSFSIGVWILYVAVAVIIVITIIFMVVYTFYKESKQTKGQDTRRSLG